MTKWGTMGWTVTSIARYYILQTTNTVFDYKRNLFLDLNKVLGVNAGWGVTDRKACRKASGQYQARQYLLYLPLHLLVMVHSDSVPSSR